MAVARSALDVVALDDMKHELGIPLTETSLDSTLEAQITAAVDWVSKEIQRPLVAREKVYLVRQFPRDALPMGIAHANVASVLRIDYWAPEDDIRLEAPRMIAGADLGRLGRASRHDPLYSGGSYVYGPADGWPVSHETACPEVILELGWQAEPGVVQAVKLLVRDYYEGRSALPRGGWAVERLLESSMWLGGVPGI